MSQSIHIAADGTVRFVYSDELATLLPEGESRIDRVSVVNPSPEGWYADLNRVGGPFLGAFRLRRDALDAELEWLEARLHELAI